MYDFAFEPSNEHCNGKILVFVHALVKTNVERYDILVTWLANIFVAHADR